jgi:hypothetical protein
MKDNEYVLRAADQEFEYFHLDQIIKHLQIKYL